MEPTRPEAKPASATPTPAEHYERVYVPAIFARMTRELLSRAAPRPAEHALDLACGTGVVARGVAPLVGDAGRVVAVDRQPGMLSAARAAAGPAGAAIEWREGDAVTLDLPDASFDLVLCQQGLQFMDDRCAAVRQMRRVLRAGGRAGVAVWRSIEENHLFAALAQAELRHLGGLGVTEQDVVAPFSLGDATELHDLFEQAGFGRIEITQPTIEVRFPSAATFVRDVEYPYSAFMPQFAADPAAFDAFVSAVEADTREVVERHRVGDEVGFSMVALVALAQV